MTENKKFGIMEKLGCWAGSLLKIGVLAALAYFGYAYWQNHPEEGAAAIKTAILGANRLGDQILGRATLKRDIRTQMSVVVKKGGVGDDSLTEVQIGEGTLPAGKAVRLVYSGDPDPNSKVVYVAVEVLAMVARADLETAFEKAEKAYGKAGEKSEK